MQLIAEIKQVVYNARKHTYQAINAVMVEAYWEIGRRIVEEEQQGSERAAYGKELLKTISFELTSEFGKGFSERSLREFRQFYLSFPEDEIRRTLFAKLNWSHFQRVLRVSDEKARMFYLREAADHMWSVRTLDRNISTLSYQRLVSTQKASLNAESGEKNVGIKQNDEFIKNPSVLEFLNLPSGMSYTEEELIEEIEREKLKFKLNN